MLFGVSYHDMLMEFVGPIPFQVLYAYLMTTVLNVRHKKAYWVVSLAMILLFTPFRSAMAAPVRIAFGLFLSALPVFFSRGSLTGRVVIAFVGFVLMTFAELPLGLLWTLVVSDSFSIYDVTTATLPHYLVLSVVHVTLMWALFVGFRRVLRRYYGGASDDAWAGSRLFMWFLVVQVVLLGTALVTAADLLDSSTAVFAALAALAALCIGADAVMFSAMRDYAVKLREDRRSAALQEQLDGYLEEYSPLVRQMEEAACMRHDVRNQVGMAQALADHGDFEGARAHVALLRQRVGESAGAVNHGDAR